jgi:MYXO-CTERM domain-containing protein
MIRVWRSSRAGALAPSASNGWADNSCDPAVEVLTLPLEDYVKGVIPREWIPTWHPEALRAGAIVARTFGAKWALRGGRWDCADVDDGTVTQVYRDDRAATTDEAVDATAGQVVMRGDVVISTEYSAENTDPTATGVDDPTCTGTTRFGHGRGMCQWGTQRWAKGICANPPCDFGAFGPEPKLHEWMVEHYYPGAIVVTGSSEPVPPCKLIPPEGDILDDAGPCFNAFGDPMYWRTETVGWDGGLRWTNAFEAAAPGNWARWQMFFEASGEYAVDVYVDPAFGAHKTTRYSVTHAGGDAEVIVDQGAADGWTRLGVWSFDAQGEVSVYDNESAPVVADQHIVVDAIRITPMGTLGDAGLDAGVDRDASVGLDAGSDLDAAVESDASLDAGLRIGGDVSGGCGCHVGAPARSPSPAWLLLLPLVLLGRRRLR